MDLRQLRYFLKVAECRQFTAAAKELSMAQPPLSQQIRQLEAELGLALFKREPREVKLTEAGKLLLRRAEEMLELAKTAKEELSDLRRGIAGTLALGMISSSGSFLWNDGLQRFRRDFPQVHFSLRDGNTFQLLELLEKGLIDLAVVRTPFSDSECHCHYLNEEPMTASMTADLDWCPDAREIALPELKARPLIIYRRFFNLIDKVCQEHGFAPEVCCLNDDARTTILWANAGMGIAVTPESAVGLAAHENLHVKRLKCQELATGMAVIWRKDRYISAIVQEFLSYVLPTESLHEQTSLSK